VRDLADVTCTTACGKESLFCPRRTNFRAPDERNSVVDWLRAWLICCNLASSAVSPAGVSGVSEVALSVSIFMAGFISVTTIGSKRKSRG